MFCRKCDFLLSQRVLLRFACQAPFLKALNVTFCLVAFCSGFRLCLAELEAREGAAVLFWSLLGPFSAFFHCTLVCFASFTPFRLVFLANVAPLPVPYTPRLSPKTVRSFSFGSFAKCSHVSVLPLLSFSLFRCAVFGVPRVLTLCLYAYVT